MSNETESDNQPPILRGTYEELLIKVTEKYLDDSEFVAIELSENLNFTITIKGDNWDGEYIDARIAEYVIELQRVLQKCIANNLGVITALRGKHKPLVKVKLRKGSAEIYVKFFEFIKPYIDRMTPTQQMILILVILGLLAGGWGLKRVLEYFSSIDERDRTSDRDKRTLALLEKSIEANKEALEPIRMLITKMDEGDKIRFSDGNIELEYKDAKKMFPRKPKSEYSIAYVDNEYEVCDINLEEKTIEVAKNGNKLRADLILNPEDLSAFYNSIKAQQQQSPRELPCMDLNINIEFNAYRIKSASILGTGAPRPGARSLDSLRKLL